MTKDEFWIATFLAAIRAGRWAGDAAMIATAAVEKLAAYRNGK